jgi:hypothetical protein
LRFALVEDSQPPPKRVHGEIIAEEEDKAPIVNVIYHPALAADDVNAEIIRVE